MRIEVSQCSSTLCTMAVCFSHILIFKSHFPGGLFFTVPLQTPAMTLRKTRADNNQAARLLRDFAQYLLWTQIAAALQITLYETVFPDTFWPLWTVSSLLLPPPQLKVFLSLVACCRRCHKYTLVRFFCQTRSDRELLAHLQRSLYSQITTVPPQRTGTDTLPAVFNPRGVCVFPRLF